MSDLHITRNEYDKVFGVNVRKNFESCVSHIKNLEQDGDRLIILGDVSHDNSKESYEFVESTLQKLKMPISSIPGNHDGNNYDSFSYGKNTALNNEHASYYFVDSRGCGNQLGYISSEKIDEIYESVIAENVDTRFVLLHHDIVQPYPPNRVGVCNSSINNIISRFFSADGPKIIFLNGHRHQYYSMNIGNLAFISVPATSRQFSFHESKLIYSDPNPAMLLAQNNGANISVDYVTPSYREII
jgi:calcineurin-like phosphoesterase